MYVYVYVGALHHMLSRYEYVDGQQQQTKFKVFV